MRLLLPLGLVAVLLAATACGRRGPPPDVILVVADTLRADYLELYGHPRPNAPFLARLGAQSAVFTHAFSTSSWTAPATASLFTGLYPTQHGVRTGFFAVRRKARREGVALHQLPPFPTLPELLRERGYSTFGVAANVNVGPEIGFSRGFDRFERLHDAPIDDLVEQLGVWEEEIHARRPTFLYVHPNDVHAPYEPRAPWFRPEDDPRERERAAYESEIRVVDQGIERLLARFDPEGRALVLVLSDHGEEFWDHGRVGHPASLHHELHRVVWIVHGPALGVRPARLDLNVSLIDVLPTVLELVGGEPPPELAGRSLAPLLLDRRGAESTRVALADRTLFAHRFDPVRGRELWAAVHGREKLIEADGERRLYDLRSDTEERHDLAAERPDSLDRLARALEAFRAEGRGAAPAPVVHLPLDREREAQLRALGYLAD
jgi:arylsulfatase A-like enzyme